MGKLASKILRHLAAMTAVVLVGGLLSATLLRLAPGFDVDEEQLDSHLSSESIQALRQARAGDRNIGRFYLHYLGRACRGDLGQSRTLNRPVRELLAERLPVTVRLVGAGLLAGWLCAVLLAVGATMARRAACNLAATVLGGIFLSLPAAVLALLFVFARAPAYLVIALVVFPKVFSYTRNLLAKSYGLPHLVTAYAKGLGPLRVLVWHVLPVAGTQLLAVAGISVSIALGAAIPVEALCGVAGIGQLAWQAALGRDLPLLVNLTVLVTVITLAANWGSELAGQGFRTSAA
jgi:ABC-type dipeptide/oligopeptide/nickel transport system permease component